MKKFISLPAAILCFLVVASAQDKPNFSGTWIVVTPVEHAGQEETITHDATSLRVSHGSEGGHHASVYKLDGTPSRNVLTSHGAEIVSLATTSWKDGQLVIQQSTQYPDGKKIESRLTFALNSEGQLVRQITDTVEGKVSPTITVVARKKQ
jgi:hypothetical protein